MNLFRDVRAVVDASTTGFGTIDWDAVAEAAKSATDPGSLDLTDAERTGYAADVRDACDRLVAVAEVELDMPEVVEVQNRRHWIDANVVTFRRVMVPFEEHDPTVLPGFTRAVNTGSFAFVLSSLGNNVLGQYDPLLLADGDDDHGLYSVHPNIRRVADSLDVDYPWLHRWIAFHEVSHTAEFGAAPWLSAHLESWMRRGVDALIDGGLDHNAFHELNTTMAAVEGYAELLVNRAFNDDYEDLHRKLDERRQGGGPAAKLVRRLLGLGLRRQQYERGARFFEHVADERGVAAASRVWDHPENLPTDTELDAPERWVTRVSP